MFVCRDCGGVFEYDIDGCPFCESHHYEESGAEDENDLFEDDE